MKSLENIIICSKDKVFSLVMALMCRWDVLVSSDGPLGQIQILIQMWRIKNTLGQKTVHGVDVPSRIALWFDINQPINDLFKRFLFIFNKRLCVVYCTHQLSDPVRFDGIWPMLQQYDKCKCP